MSGMDWNIVCRVAVRSSRLLLKLKFLSNKNVPIIKPKNRTAMVTAKRTVLPPVSKSGFTLETLDAGKRV